MGKRRTDPDGRLRPVEPTRRSAGGRNAATDVLDQQEFESRQQDRGMTRGMDADTLQLTGQGISNAVRESRLARPLGKTADPRDSRLVRQLPEPDAVRTPLSAHQRRERNKVKSHWEDGLPAAQSTAVRQMVDDREQAEGTWRRVNDRLADEAGDLGAFRRSEQADVQRVKRMDRAIQAYEQQAGGRGHIVYVNTEMPSYVNHSSLHSYVPSAFRPGDQLDIDRYAIGSQSMDEVEVADPARAGRTAVLEIQTGRGVYLGHSGRGDSSHVLPRGMQVTVVGAHEARYRRPDGTEGRRIVIQCVDSTHDPRQGQEGKEE